jgi:aminoglycoside phosphotransferase (APT) family kinase protein
VNPLELGVQQDTDTTWMRAHLERHAGRYDPTLAHVTVDAVATWRQVRPVTCLHGFQLRPIRRDRPVLDVVVKVASTNPDATGPRDPLRARPRLGPVTDDEEKYRCEYRTMAAVQSHFGALADPRFGAVRVFDHIGDHRAIVFEAMAWPTLRELTARTIRRSGHRAFARLEPAYQRAGAWLRAFHDIAAPPQLEVRRRHGEEVRRDLGAYVAHLRASGVDHRAVAVTAEVIAGPPPGWFPSSYPLVWNHGDYAGRNLFIGPELRVAAFDPLGRWSTPRYEDVAFFLTALRSVRSRLTSRLTFDDIERVDRLETAFLVGYGAKEVLTPAALCGYRLLLLLDRWCAVRTRLGTASQRAATDRSFGRSTRRLLERRPHHDPAAVW